MSIMGTFKIVPSNASAKADLTYAKLKNYGGVIKVRAVFVTERIPGYDGTVIVTEVLSYEKDLHCGST